MIQQPKLSDVEIDYIPDIIFEYLFNKTNCLILDSRRIEVKQDFEVFADRIIKNLIYYCKIVEYQRFVYEKTKGKLLSKPLPSYTHARKMINKYINTNIPRSLKRSLKIHGIKTIVEEDYQNLKDLRNFLKNRSNEYNEMIKNKNFGKSKLVEPIF
ncbi:MAG: hypothetical protein M0R03_23415 [Novosphingobium sp.]|nr:hypothetical protein [Novosphingobium sp.]